MPDQLTSPPPGNIQPAVAPSADAQPEPQGPSVFQAMLLYQQDLWERSILFWDTLRIRGDNALEHERLGLPPLLAFKSETIMDGRTFDRPVNYALLRITEAHGIATVETARAERPVIVFDPRAGHGPGIGGFKEDSEVGMALRGGHPVYFVIFFPEPCREQTLADVLHALRRFVETVAARHSGKPPALYGNCQAGWAITLLSADCEGIVGPAVLNGSPLSYWAGAVGVNPMRLIAGLTGGAWLVRFLADLGDGRFDGAWLVQNFENLKPEAVWSKYADLFTHIDTQTERFLAFERWWNGFYFLGRDEITAIVQNLFIGNQIERGVFRICECCFADLRRIRNPLLIFASRGDDITPPHQALGWIPAVYPTTNDLKQAGQRIAYMINPHVGHLGIFVSASVARAEHRAILSNLDALEALAPGLYEMKLDDPSETPGAESRVRFEERQIEELPRAPTSEAYERVSQLSELFDATYRTLISPWVRATASPWSATLTKWLHPMRTSRYAAATPFNPWLAALAPWAEAIRRARTPLPDENAWITAERSAIAQTVEALAAFRSSRDQAGQAAFDFLYGAAPNAQPPSRSSTDSAAGADVESRKRRRRKTKG